MAKSRRAKLMSRKRNSKRISKRNMCKSMKNIKQFYKSMFTKFKGGCDTCVPGQYGG